ncbi:reverse transcriptase [Phytophthora megakarya]|uniref:Reverse transcriptase n=1 Tax=Phytophthora megakarya TaxID=4795 RepID=A0A225WC49_9STRA|nr:reverse transcriptase [Phytophthora megakarya]
MLVLMITDLFGEASGLCLNRGKTIAIALHRDGLTSDTTWVWPIQLQGVTQRCRYLGIQVGSRPDVMAMWHLAGKQLQVRLHLASQKLLSTDQRSRVAAAVIIPKLLFIARHAWPTTEIVALFTDRIAAFIWGGTFDEPESLKAWLARDATRLPRREGGLAAPDLKAELLAMAATTVTRWATTSTTTELVVGDMLAPRLAMDQPPPVYITPGHSPRPVDGFRETQSLWSAGIMMIRAAGSAPPADGHGALVAEVYASVHSLVQTRLKWNGNTAEIMIPVAFREKTAALRDFFHHHYGIFRSEWLPYAELDRLPMYDATGSRCHIGEAFPGMTWDGQQIQKLLTWTHHSWGLTIRSRQHSNESALQHLVVLLLANYPTLMLRDRYETELRLSADPVDHPIHAKVSSLADEDTVRQLTIEVSAQEAAYETTIASRHAALREITAYAGEEVRVHAIHPHPLLDRLVCLWAGKRRWKQPRHVYKTASQLAARARGTRNIERRMQDWKAEDEDIYRSISSFSWLELRRITGSSVWGEQVLHRLKLRAFRQWDPTTGQPGCPIEECHTFVPGLVHLFWKCPAASTLWNTFHEAWRIQGLMVNELSKFTIDLPNVPTEMWTRLDRAYANVTQQERNAIAAEIYDVINAFWRIGTVTTLQAIWRRRCSYWTSAGIITADVAPAILRGRLTNGYATVRHHLFEQTDNLACKRAIMLVSGALATDSNYPTQTVPRTLSSLNRTCTHVLFFDGGSRGNPGPGGSGTALVEVNLETRSTCIKWLASVSYAARSTTNNVAEYCGLLTGLRYAHRAHISNIHVVGDSKLILNQVSRRSPPRAAHLKGLYAQCRMLADQVAVSTWTHHLRRFNKMADGLANIAMDRKTSTQIFPSDITFLKEPWTTVSDSLQGDIEHWFDLKEGAGTLNPNEGVP